MKQNSRSWKIALVVLALLLTLSLCSCQGIAMLLLRNAPSSSEQSSGQTTEQQNQTGSDTPAADSDAYLPDAENAISQSDTTPTEHGSAGDQVFAVSDVVKMVQDSVVQIYVTTREGTSAGSGVIVSSTGHILTCNHVVEGATAITIELSDNKTYDATLLGADEVTDLAVVKIEPSADRPLTKATHGKSAGLVAGEYVVAIGNPLGTLGGSVTQGIISATERQIQITNDNGSTYLMTLLQTDAAINSGNSGGGLFNLKGELIGIVNAKYARAGVEGLSFAIPIDTALPIELDLMKDGTVHGRPDAGIELSYRYIQTVFGYQQLAGIYVDSSAYSTELLVDDRILSLNGVSVSTLGEYRTELYKCKVGDTVTIAYYRTSSNGQSTTGTVSITLRET